MGLLLAITFQRSFDATVFAIVLGFYFRIGKGVENGVVKGVEKGIEEASKLESLSVLGHDWGDEARGQ